MEAMNNPMEYSKDKKIYVKFSLSKYPFLKTAKIGSTGKINYKGEITSSNTDGQEDEVSHDVTFSDLTSKRESMRV